MKETKQPVLHIIIFGLLLVAALFLFYLTQHQLTALSQAQAKANSLSENQSRLATLESSLPVNSILASTWLRTLPTNEKDVAAFATQIEGLAKAQSLTIDIRFDDFPGPVDISGHYIAGLGAEVTLMGSFTGVTNFLSNLSGLPYFFKIDKMTLTKPEAKSGVKAVFDGYLMMNLKI